MSTGVCLISYGQDKAVVSRDIFRASSRAS
jgi:hypothetical protein